MPPFYPLVSVTGLKVFYVLVSFLFHLWVSYKGVSLVGFVTIFLPWVVYLYFTLYALCPLERLNLFDSHHVLCLPDRVESLRQWWPPPSRVCPWSPSALWVCAPPSPGALAGRKGVCALSPLPLTRTARFVLRSACFIYTFVWNPQRVFSIRYLRLLLFTSLPYVL